MMSFNKFTSIYLVLSKGNTFRYNFLMQCQLKFSFHKTDIFDKIWTAKFWVFWVYKLVDWLKLFLHSNVMKNQFQSKIRGNLYCIFVVRKNESSISGTEMINQNSKTKLSDPSPQKKKKKKQNYVVIWDTLIHLLFLKFSLFQKKFFFSLGPRTVVQVSSTPDPFYFCLSHRWFDSKDQDTFKGR